MPRRLQQRLQWTAPLKPNKSKNCNPDVYLLSGQIEGTSIVPAETRGIECCASGYPELRSLQ